MYPSAHNACPRAATPPSPGRTLYQSAHNAPAAPGWTLIIYQGLGCGKRLYLGAFLLYLVRMSAPCPQSEASSANVPPPEAAAIAGAMRADAPPDASVMRADASPDAIEMRGPLDEPPRPAKKRRRVNPYAPSDRLKMIDGRRREAKIVAATKKALIAHVGGAPAPPQMILIDQCAILILRLRLLDRRNGRGELSEKAAQEYLCWNNALIRTLQAIGLQPSAAPPGPSLADYLSLKGPTDDR